MQITDEMVRQACEAYVKYCPYTLDHDAMRAALEAALSGRQVVPVAEVTAISEHGHSILWLDDGPVQAGSLLYTTPPAQAVAPDLAERVRELTSAIDELIMTAEWAKSRLSRRADECWNCDVTGQGPEGNGRAWSRSIWGAFADFDEAVKKCRAARALEGRCQCFGTTGLHASTHGRSDGARCCDLCGLPVAEESTDVLTAVNSEPDNG